MAFSQSTLIRASNGKPRDGFSLYTYKSNDNLAAVTTADYFGFNSRFDLNPKDVIYAQLGDGFARLEMTTETTAAPV